MIGTGYTAILKRADDGAVTITLTAEGAQVVADALARVEPEYQPGPLDITPRQVLATSILKAMNDVEPATTYDAKVKKMVQGIKQ